MDRIDVPSLELERFERVLEPEPYRSVLEAMGRARELLGGRRVWLVNSTAKGGGVAEMLKPVVGYLRGAGWDAAWVVIDGDEGFFRVTKRIHNHLHGDEGDDGELDADALGAYDGALERTRDELLEVVGPRDVVFLHDPQTLGLAPALADAGARVVWACHVGIDEPNDVVRRAWDALRGYLEGADVCLFSRRSYVWEGLDEGRVRIVPPGIDPLSPKNQPLEADDVAAILADAGIRPDGPATRGSFEREDGSRGTITERADVVEDAPLPASARVVLQISRWDRLKDHAGVLGGFAEHVPAALGAHLVLAGPATGGVDDDPEQDEVMAELLRARDALDPDIRERTHVARLPMGDVEASDAIVNALQRSAGVIVQKSLAEGFGLTVSEGMWKARPVVASRVGGIQDQVEDGETGFLVDDPSSTEQLGRAVTRLLEDPDAGERLGRAARERVRDRFLLARYLADTAEVIEDVTGRGRARVA
jgi:trehalose synthase